MKVEEFRCDRCGALIRHPRFRIGRAFVRISTNVGFGLTTGKTADLCPKCNDELHRFLFNYTAPSVDESQVTEDTIAAERMWQEANNGTSI